KYRTKQLASPEKRLRADSQDGRPPFTSNLILFLTYRESRELLFRLLPLRIQFGGLQIVEVSATNIAQLFVCDGAVVVGFLEFQRLHLNATVERRHAIGPALQGDETGAAIDVDFRND